MSRWAGFATIVAGAALSCAPSVAHAQTRHDFDIAPQPLESALVQFADQSGVSLALPDGGLGDAQSHGVRGALPETDALARLLTATGFRSEQTGNHAFRIVAAPRRHATAQPTPPEEIIVTAARRASSVQDLPRSISDINEQRLDQLPARDGNALAGEMSGVLFTDVGMGRDKIYIRGVSDGALTGHAQSTVGIYLDGVRITYAAPDPQLQLVDVARVDVLRGPQGALYGAGSIGGIFSVESNPPDATAFYGSILAGAESTHDGGGLGTNTELVVNAPLIANRLAVRFAGYNEHVAGWVDNVSAGRTDANDLHRVGGRLSAQLDLNADWRVRAFVANQSIDAGDAQYLVESPGGDYQRPAHLLEPHDNDFVMAGGSIHGITQYGVVDSTTAIVRHQINSRYDATGSFSGLGVNPALPRPLDDHNALDIVVHETRLTSPAGVALPWFLGIFYADGDNRSGRALRDGAAGSWPLTAYAEQRRDAIDELAVFGETTWRLLPDLTLSTGLRLFRYDVRFTSDVREDLLALTSHTQGHLQESDAAPDIRLAYEASDHALFYLAASEGYRSAGFNSGEPVGTVLSTATQPFRRYTGDELWTYEAGARLSLFDARLFISAAAFYNDWRRVQTDELISNNLPYSGNVGDVGAWGYESDIRYDATDKLTLRAHLLVSEPEFNRRDPSFPAVVHGLPGAPELAVSGALSYDDDLIFGPLDMSAHAELSATFVGDSVAGFSNLQHRDSYTRTDASLSLGLSNVDLLLYAENLFDVAGVTFSDANPYSSDGPFVTRLRPFTLGFEIRRRF